MHSMGWLGFAYTGRLLPSSSASARQKIVDPFRTKVAVEYQRWSKEIFF